MSEPKIYYTRYMPEHYVNDYLKLGWTLGCRGEVIYRRGGHDIYMLVWLCECPMRLPGDLSAPHTNGPARAGEPAAVRD